MQVPMSGPDLTAAEIEAVREVLETRYLSIGPRLQAFEKGFRGYLGTAHAAGVSSGTAGLHLCMIAAGIGPGDLVVTTPFSFIASANCILYEGGVPVFVDVDEETGNLDPALAVRAIEDLMRGERDRWLPPRLRGRDTGGALKAVLPVHAFGQPADMDPLLAAARQHGLRVVEDACEAPGATYKGRRAGSLGDAAVFAFYPNKQLTTGEGGMVVTDHADWDALFRSLRNQGRDVFDAWLNHTRLGYNYRLDEMSAALGKVQLDRIEELLAKRAHVAERYNEALGDVPGVSIPAIVPATTRMSWFVYVVRITHAKGRDAVMAELDGHGVPSRPYFTPIHLQPFYVEKFGYRRGDFPVTERLGDTCLALPFSSVMTDEQVDYVCARLADVLAA